MWPVLIAGAFAPTCGGRIQGDGYLEDGSQHVGEECIEELHCEAGATCFEQTCVSEGLFRVSLAWDRRTDLDLHAMTPSGFEIYWESPEHVSGELDVDDCEKSDCASWDGPHVENVVFHEDAQVGTYRVWVENFDGRRSSDWWIELAGDQVVPDEWSGNLPREIGVTSDVFEFTFSP
jgi:hypothetical protein